MKLDRTLFILLAACFLIRLLFALRVPANDFFYPDGYDYSRVAVGIAEGRGFYPPEMKPIMAYRAPLYCFFLGGIYRVAGVKNLPAVRWIQCLLAAATAWLLYGIGRNCGSRNAGLLAAALFTSHPFFIYHPATIAAETLLTFCAVLTYYFLFKLFIHLRFRDALFGGATLGLAALTKGTVLLILPAAVLTLLLVSPGRRWRAWWLGVVLGTAALVTISPVTLWTFQRWHQFSLILDGSGLNFYIANSDDSVRLFQAKTSEEFQAVQGHLWQKDLLVQDKQIEALGPAERDAHYFRQGLPKFKENPARSLWLMTERLKIFWKPWVHPLAYGKKEVIISALVGVPLFFFGFWGVLQRMRRQQPEAIFFLLAILPITLVTGMLFNTEIRFRIPLIDSLLIVFAALSLTELLDRRRNPNPEVYIR